MEEVRQGVVVPLRKRLVWPSPQPKVKRVRPVFTSEGEVLELFGERRREQRPVTELRDRVPPYRLF